MASHPPRNLKLPSIRAVILGGIGVGLVTLVYLGWQFANGWIAHDEGLIGHTAERTLKGEIPHVQFQDVYTGLLSHLNAITFRLLGMSLASLRIPLLIGATFTTVVWYWIALRFVQPVLASCATLACLVWSFPNYFAALPSWYILMLASWALWALLKFHESKARRYLLLAGVLSGLSLLFKIVGLYLVAASLFAIWIGRLTYHSDERTNSDSPNNPNKQAVLLTMALAAVFILLACILIGKHLSFSTAIYFVLPIVCAMGAVITIYQRSITKLTASIHDCTIFLLSLSLPLTIFALPYGLQGQLDLLWHGLFELPSSRLDQATALPPLGIWALGSIPLIALVLFSGRLPQSMSLPLTVTVALAGASIVILSSTPIIYQAAFLTVQSSLSAICILVWFHSKRDNADVSVVIVAIVAASMGLTQYPYSSGIYFCYCAPLAGLTLTAVVGRTIKYDKPLWASFALVLVLFGVLHLNFKNPRRIGTLVQQLNNQFELNTARSGLYIMSTEQLEYNSILQQIGNHSKPDDYILAGPDCPQFYFLSGRRNPTPQCYDLFRAHQLGSQEALEAELKELILEHDIQVFILNQLPEFSSGYTDSFLKWIYQWGVGLPVNGSGRFAVIHKKPTDPEAN